jgi:Holliday junction resolvase
MKEKAIEDKIKDYLFQKGIYHFKIHGSKFMPAGLPDIVCCFRGSFLGIEVKRPGAKNEQSEQQKVHERNIIKSGGTYLLVDSLEEVVDYISSREEIFEKGTDIKNS